MNWKVLKTEEDYNNASLRLMEIFLAKPDTPENDELDLLLVLVKDYDDKHNDLPELDVLEVIKYKCRKWVSKQKILNLLLAVKDIFRQSFQEREKSL